MTSTSGTASIPDIPIVQKLSMRIVEALKKTNTETTDQFLPVTELDGILSIDTLVALFTELCRAVWGHNQLQLRRADLETYARRAREDPPRLSLLALLIYDKRKDSLSTFVDWLRNGGTFPSDNDLPFQETSEALHVLPKNDHQYILRNQCMFCIVTITEYEHATLQRDLRKPFLGKQQLIKGGSSGAVYKVKIAAGHWRYKHHEFPKFMTTQHDIDIAVKVFEERESHAQAGLSAQQDYETEREFLEELKKNKTQNVSILRDWGSLAEPTERTDVKKYSLFFECANCDLQEFLEHDLYSQEYKGKSVLLTNATHLLEALAFIHGKFHFLHLDIKPDNILVFFYPLSEVPAGTNETKRMEWRITDFNLSRKQLRRKPDQSFEVSVSTSYESEVLSPRGAGHFQAPEIEDQNPGRASGRSDVWSMGCVLLMVLACLCDGRAGVKDLLDRTAVTFKGEKGGEGMSTFLFYMTKSNDLLDSMIGWPGPNQPPIRYLGQYKPQVHTIRPNLDATIHPEVIHWSEIMYDKAVGPEKQCLEDAFRLLFTRVLVVNRSERLRAEKFYKYFKQISQSYKEAKEPGSGAVPPLGDIPGPEAERPSTMNMRDRTKHSPLCDAIGDIDAARVIALLRENANPNEKCPLCDKWPICKTLRSGVDPRNNILQALLEPRSISVLNTDITIARDSTSSPLDIAWHMSQGAGDHEALELLFTYRSADIPVDDKFERRFERSKKKLSANSLDVIKDYRKSWKAAHDV